MNRDILKTPASSERSYYDFGSGTFWVGKRGLKGELDCNPYLICEKDEAVLLDPGSPLDFETVLSQVKQIVSLDQIKLIVVHHQDPDLCASLPLFEKAGLTCPIALHWRASVMVKYYGQENDFYLVNQNNWHWEFSTGRRLEFLPAYYCHFPGAIMTYDRQTKILYSGDLFGAFIKDSPNLFAEEGYRESMKSFHEHYMPSREILKGVMERVKNLDLKLIAPQHGRVISENIPLHIETLSNLPCGSYSSYSEKDSLEHKAEEKLLQDNLTGLKNQDFYKTYIEKLLSEGSRHSWGSLYLEITNISSINELHGREGGDKILKGIAYFLNQFAGDNEECIICKLRTPVFVVTCPEEDEQTLAEKAEHILEEIGHSSHLSEKVLMAISVTHRGEDGQECRTYAEWNDLNRAKLVIAKEEGKNGIVRRLARLSPNAILKKKVLLVDPDSSYIPLIEKELEARGIIFMQVHDGTAALERRKGWNPDLIIAEALTPKLNGFLLKEKLNSLSGLRNLPFIMISPRKDEEYITRAASLGILHYLKKPFSLKELEGLIINLLER